MSNPEMRLILKRIKTEFARGTPAKYSVEMVRSMRILDIDETFDSGFKHSN